MMMRKKHLFFDLKRHSCKLSLPNYTLITIFLLLGFFSSHLNADALYPLTIKTQHKLLSFSVRIAKTEREKSVGLMYQHYLPDDEGMLFIYDHPEQLSFWMKNTFIPLDILFIDSNQQIVDIQTMQPCLDETCPIYYSKSAAVSALEINGGLSKKLGIQIADFVTLKKIT